MLSEEQRATLLKFYSTVKLNEAQLDELAQAYWAATREERGEIAKVYAHTFVDPTFVQRLIFFHDYHMFHTAAGPDSSAPARAGCAGASSSFAGQQSDSSSLMASRTSFSTVGSPTAVASQAPRRTHAQRLLRSTIQEHFPKLTGPGPFALQFGCVQSEKAREEVIELYASQFLHPDPPELHRIVTLPSNFSTRTRKRISGSYSWYLRCLATQEIVCAVTVSVHQQETIRFAEMPLFATGVGYKKNGFGRLLNAALLDWCADVGLEFLMISADVQAIPFWRHLGYRAMTRGEKNRIDFFYQHDCCKFKDAETMIGYCVAERRSGGSDAGGTRRRDVKSGGSEEVLHRSVAQVLAQLPRFVLQGPAKLPTE
ncbi:hypothetical protein LSCM1_00217 [Leishmania martiniquensis]|uniref:N-acetyltransferase domain-containing protein n=1 Tax=Leishmania martiniquensis TaxID=1580590 RepID=A0A836FK41_9TRYP|nr:hypothetical protein LSCM1_00217 [Leishmania martiniquensis]